MKLILTREVAGLGTAGDVVTVKDGYARNFLLSCEDLLGLEVDDDAMCVNYRGRRVRVRNYPISIDADGFIELAASDAVAAEEALFLRRRRRHLVVRVDRTDLSKNILRGFTAFDTFLDRHPDFREDITFFAMLQPSRQDVPEYVEYVERTGHEAPGVHA